jgi:hypothetical protein
LSNSLAARGQQEAVTAPGCLTLGFACEMLTFAERGWSTSRGNFIHAGLGEDRDEAIARSCGLYGRVYGCQCGCRVR